LFDELHAAPHAGALKDVTSRSRKVFIRAGFVGRARPRARPILGP
jgi:hypothetical protein